MILNSKMCNNHQDGKEFFFFWGLNLSPKIVYIYICIWICQKAILIPLYNAYCLEKVISFFFFFFFFHYYPPKYSINNLDHIITLHLFDSSAISFSHIIFG